MSLLQDTFEIQQESIKPGQKVLIVDDLLATGGIQSWEL
jgi:adenine/guanine phosphoribosyltransferase-like PRPP-binding protein